MKKLLFLAGISLLSFQSMYAFSHMDQSVIEITDIVNSPQLRRFIPPQEFILDIQRVSNGYIITTNHYQVFVEVRYRPRAGLQSGGEADNQKKEYEIQINEPKKIS